MRIVIPYKETLNKDEIDGIKVIDEVNAVYNSINENGNEVKVFPIDDEASIVEFVNFVTDFEPDCIVNLFESYKENNYGEVWFAGLLELLNIPYTGSPPRVLSTCLDKNLSKIIFNNYQIPTADYHVIRSPEDIKKCNIFPGFVKPINEDASAGIDRYSLVLNKSQLKEKIKSLIENKFNLPYIVEEYIDGKEFTIPIFEGIPLDIIEYKFPKGFNFRTYKLKWEIETEEEQIEFVTDKVNKRLKEKIFNYSRKIYQIFKINDYARVDLRINKNNEIFFLEVNPNTDITPYTGFCLSLKRHNISYKDFILKLINNAIKRLSCSHEMDLFIK